MYKALLWNRLLTLGGDVVISHLLSTIAVRIAFLQFLHYDCYGFWENYGFDFIRGMNCTIVGVESCY